MLAAMCGFLFLASDPAKDGRIVSAFMGTKGLLTHSGIIVCVKTLCKAQLQIKMQECRCFTAYQLINLTVVTIVDG